MQRVISIAVGVVAILFAGVSHAASIDIDLNDFLAVNVFVELDGSAALLLETGVGIDPRLDNNPILGDPNIIIPGVGVSMLFDYRFFDGPDNDSDEFLAYLYDASNPGAPNYGFPIPGFEFSVTSDSSGTVEFDLSSLTTLILGMKIILREDLGDSSAPDSSVIIENMRLTAVPAPAAIWLFGSALIGFVGFGKRRNAA